MSGNCGCISPVRLPNSVSAVTNLKICQEQLQGRYRIEVIDLLLNPQLAKGDQIIAIPTVVRRLPAPVKRLSGIDRRPNARWWD